MNPRVVFNVPNTICYVRLLLLAASLWTHFPLLYALSVLLDMLDGEAARRLGQCTILGAILDMVADRASNIVIVCKIQSARPDSFLLLLLVLDFVSHFVHFTGHMMTGSSHKKVSGLLAVYYDRRVLVPVCVFSEAFFLASYLGLKQSDDLRVFYYVKSFFHAVQLASAVRMVSELQMA